MNDFTREELKNLRACLDVCIADDGSDEQLMNKLEPMIDNYCSDNEVAEAGKKMAKKYAKALNNLKDR